MTRGGTFARVRSALLIGAAVWWSACSGEDPPPQMSRFTSIEEMGEALFHDTNLSNNGTMACATCHDPDRGFTDGRTDSEGRVRAVSLGADGVSLGDRNAPTAGYAQLTPPFGYGMRVRHNKQNQNNLYEGALGGQFWDGRRDDLDGQAGDPLLNPIEMAMPDQAAVVSRVFEDQDYRLGLAEFFGADVLNDDEVAFMAIRSSIAAYERTEEFAPFDSRYDRFLRGEVELTFNELTGKAVFFSQFANCSICHQLYSEGDPINEVVEPFSGFEYHNIGIPTNEAVRALNGVTGADEGLASNPESAGPEERGKFRVPTLRNVAVTGPYMHNGVFAELRTVIEYYDHFNNPDVRDVNPETGMPWDPPEVPETVAEPLLRVSDPFTDTQVIGLVCFLRALTDARYEHLIEDNGIDCSL